MPAMDAQEMNGRHTLSQLAGNYREWAPNVALRDHVRCLWVNDLSFSPTRSICVVPDGCVDIVWTRDWLRIAGPDTRVSLEQLAPQGVVVGIRFHPGAASAWLGVPLSEILNARVPLAEFWGGESERLFDRASQCGETKLVAAVLEGALRTRLSKVGQPDRGICFLRQAAAAKHRSMPDGMKALARRIGLSERTLRRRCMDAFGYGFKTLDRILRLQRFFRLAEASAHPRLVELAAQTGYADQAHLTREVQRLCGATPSELVAQFSAQLADSFKTPHAYTAYVEAHEPYSEHDLERNPTRNGLLPVAGTPSVRAAKNRRFLS
jgi:AraC-like DNA-binding protein